MRVVKDTPFEFGHVVWQVRPPRPSLTVVVKGTFDLVPGEPFAVIAGEQRPCHGDAWFDDDPTQSLHFDSDLAVYKPRGECFVAGSCHAPGGVPAPVASVAFAVGPVRKSLGVFGDRYWTSLGTPSAAEPFAVMPLRWERSFGGEGVTANPVGAGLSARATEAGARVALPNLEDPSRLITSPASRPSPAGFFPIPKHWESRMRRTGSYGGAWLATRWPWFPDDFDWEFFNAAPGDQRIRGFWRGDEVVALQGMHPDHPRIEARLPGVRARAFVQVQRGEEWTFEEIPLVLDTLTVDGDALKVCALWRGIIEVASERLDEVATLFYYHEPLDAHGGFDEAWMRYAAALERERAEVADLEVDVPDEDDEPDEIPEPKAAAEPFSAAMMARMAPAFAAAGVGAAAMKKLFESQPEAPAKPPQASAVKVAAANLDEAVPPEVEAMAPVADAALAPPAEAETEAPEAEPELTREAVIAHHAAGGAFAGLDLTGLRLDDLDLRGADFRGAILTRADLRRSDLRDARFDGATLAEAALEGADLRGASFVESDLAEVAGDGANATGAVFDGATGDQGRWAGARFDGASLQRADFSGADISEASFVRANLTGAEFQSAQAARGDFTEAVLDEASFERAQCPQGCFLKASMVKFRASEGADFRGANFARARAPESAWARSDLDTADFSHAVLTRADLAESRLVTTRLDGAELTGARFDNAEMTGASLLEANCHEGNFEGARLAHADLRGANLFGAQLWRARTDEARVELANLGRTHLERSDA